MGIPIIEAPCEAESQCAFLTKYNLAHATATEDADALVFGTKILIRNLIYQTQKLLVIYFCLYFILSY